MIYKTTCPPNGVKCRLEVSWIALVEALLRLQRQPYRWPVGRVMFQKLAYFATEAGIPTELTFQRGSYGPFASGLKAVTARLMNNGLLYEEPLGRMLEVRVGTAHASARVAYRESLREWDEPIDRLVDLMSRMRTSEAEIAATVHFAWKELIELGQPSPSESDVLESVMEWKLRRRPPLDEGAVAESIRALSMLEWLNVRASPDLPVDEAALVGTF